MADYHRILSYLYRYDKNEKKECRGFVKAEQKRSGLKLTIQIEDDRLMEDMNLDLCFYQKREDHWEIRRMDQLAAANHQEETTLFYASERLPDDFDIRKQHGILLIYRDSFLYGSVWIGDEIPMTALMESYRPPQEPPDDSGEEMEAMPGPEDSISRKNQAEYIEPISEPIKPEEALITGEEEKEEPEWESGEEPEEEPELKSEEEPEEKLSTDPEDLLIKMWINTGKKPQPVDNIFNKAFRQGYKISLEQLKNFSPEAERMAENQFLLKGYHRYQHLLAGKVMYAGRERYCIGVPGIYENRERYMAEIYQFPIFLSLTENRIKTGGFGYWLHVLEE